MKRVLSDGHIISRGKPPHATHNVYYADAGPDGKVVVIDFNIIPMSVILAAIAWEHDVEPYDKSPKKEFNMNGFRY